METRASASRTRASASRMRAFARRVSARDFSKRILIDSLITDFAQLARGSFSSSCSSNVVRVLECDSCFSVWLVLLECLECSSCAIECTVRLYDTPPFVIASSSASTREFEREYSRVRVRVLASSRASASTREFESECSHSQFNTRVCFTFTRVSRTRSFAILACSFACHASRSHSFVNLRLSGTIALSHGSVQFSREQLGGVCHANACGAKLSQRSSNCWV